MFAIDHAATALLIKRRFPESLLANRPTAIVLVILAQIVVTLVLVGLCARRPPSPAGPLENGRRPL